MNNLNLTTSGWVICGATLALVLPIPPENLEIETKLPTISVNSSSALNEEVVKLIAGLNNTQNLDFMLQDLDELKSDEFAPESGLIEHAKALIMATEKGMGYEFPYGSPSPEEDNKGNAIHVEWVRNHRHVVLVMSPEEKYSYIHVYGENSPGVARIVSVQALVERLDWLQQ